MARLVHIVAVNVPHHLTQRGNARQVILNSDAERSVYLELLQKYVELYQLSLLGYCLMSNHVHLLAVPHEEGALAMPLKQTHGRYASYWNATHKSSGHVWQGRFYSCPLDGAHLWIALRYAELNPVRAKLVGEASAWPWSSAAVHCQERETPTRLDLEHGGSAGQRTVGGSISLPENGRMKSQRYVSARILAGLSVQRISFTLWSRLRNADCFRKKADGLAKPA
jgi:REP element-mobilizing transposase RayT